MKFIHTSDIHIGMSPDPSMFWSDDRAKDIKETFANVIKKCKEENANLLLISGDLFNHQPLTDELTYINDLFKTIPDTYVAMVAGSYDHIRLNSPILNFTFAENVRFFKNQTEEIFNISNKRVIVHGFSYYGIEENTPIINSITPENDKNIHILLAYSGDYRHAPFDLIKLEDKNFSYVALGSEHNFQEVIKNKIYYSGSPEPLNSSEEGEHGIIIGEINEDTKRVTSLRFEKMAKVSYAPINIKINGSITESEIVDMLIREIIKVGAENIFKICFSGYRDPDLEISREMFNKKIRISEIIDNTIPKYDFVKLSSEHPQDMIGAFIRKMTNSNIELSEIEKKALYLGTNALIKSIEKSNN